FLATVALVGYATTAGAVQFSDAQGSGYEVAIRSLADAGVIGGHPDGSVRPFHTLNRAEALKVILEAQPGTSSHVKKVARTLAPLPLFHDMDQKAWYAPYVEAGFELGIVKGYPDGRFRPGN